MAEDDSAACVLWSEDEDTDEETLSTPYQRRRERLCRNWEALRMTLLQSSLRMEGFIPLKCVEGDYEGAGIVALVHAIALSAAINCTD